MFRVINDDLSFEKKEIIGEFETIKEALQCEIDNYFFNSSVEQLIDGKWKMVAINGTMYALIK